MKFSIILFTLVCSTLYTTQAQTVPQNQQTNSNTSTPADTSAVRGLLVTFGRSGLQKQPFQITSLAVRAIMTQYGIVDTDVTAIPGAVENPPLQQTSTGAWFAPADLSNTAVILIRQPTAISQLTTIIAALENISEVLFVELITTPENSGQISTKR